jgi:hypothetical protein
MKNKINAFFILIIIVLSFFTETVISSDVCTILNEEACNKLSQSLENLKDLSEQGVEIPNLEKKAEIVNEYVERIPYSHLIPTEEKKKELLKKITNSFSGLISSQRSKISDTTTFDKKLVNYIENNAQSLKKELQKLPTKDEKNELIKDNLWIEELFPLVAEPEVEILPLVVEPVVKLFIDAEISEIIKNLNQNRDEIKKFEGYLLSRDLEENEKEELKELLREQFLLGEYFSVMEKNFREEIEKAEKDLSDKELNDRAEEKTNAKINSLTSVTEIQEYLKELKSTFTRYLIRKEEIKKIGKSSLIKETDSEIFDRMFEFELKKRETMRGLDKKGLDYVYASYLDFFGGDYIDMITIAGKPLLRVFDFEHHGWTALLDQVVLDEKILDEKSIFELELSYEELENLNTDEDILKKYAERFNEEVYWKGPGVFLGIFKIPAVLAYGEQIATFGDTAAYERTGNKITTYQATSTLGPQADLSSISINEITSDFDKVIISTDGLKEVQKIKDKPEIISFDFIEENDFVKTKENIKKGTIQGTDWHLAEEKGNKRTYTKEEVTETTLTRIDDAIVVSFESYKDYFDKEAEKYVLETPLEYEEPIVVSEELYEMPEMEPLDFFEITEEPIKLVDSDIKYLFEKEFESVPQEFQAEFEQTKEDLENSIENKNMMKLLLRILRLNELLQKPISSEDKKIVISFMAKTMSIAQIISREDMRKGIFEQIRNEQFENILEKIKKLDVKEEIYSEIDKFNEEENLGIDTELLKKLLKIKTLDDLLRELRDMTLC